MVAVIRSAARVAGRRQFTISSISANAAQQAKAAGQQTKQAAETAGQQAKQAAESAGQQAKQATETAGQQAKQTIQNVAQQAKPTTQNATEQAKQTADKATNAFNDYAKKAQELGGPALKRVEGLLGGYAEPVKYNLSTAGAIAKQVYMAEGLAPPTSISSVTSAYRHMWSKASSQSYWAQVLTKGDWRRLGIYALEAYGIFTIGEMIGRRSLVGYKLEDRVGGHAHH